MRLNRTTIFALMIASTTLLWLGQTDAHVQEPMFAKPWFYAGDAPHSLVRADLDNDGDPDLVTVNFSSDDDVLVAGNFSDDGSAVTNRSIMNNPPTCNAGGSYAAECTGETTDIELDGSGSIDPDEEEVSFLWSTDCPGGVFDDNTLESPTLTIETAAPCAPLTCNVFLMIDDGTDTDSCQTTASVDDTTPPSINCPADTTIECSQSTDPAETGTATAPEYVAYRMYWTDSGTDKIQRANPDGSHVEDLVTGLPVPLGIALDVAAGKMYWTDVDTDKIQRADLDGSHIEDLVTGLGSPLYIALDLAAGQMYWTDPGTAKIQRADLDGGNVEDLVTGSIVPMGIALDVAAGKMYWTDGEMQKIQRANLDGTNVEDLITGLSGPTDIALDVAAGKMYWTSYGKIQRADLDGDNIEDLVTTGLTSLGGIALDVGAGKMYWTDRGSDKIQRADLDGSNVEDLITTGLSTPEGIALQFAVSECDPDPDVTFTDSVAAGSCPPESVITRTWTATDNCGNTSTCDQIVTVVDTSPPMIACPANAVVECTEPTDPAHTGTAVPTLLGHEKMYWIDAGTGKIQRADLDGSNIEDLVTLNLGPADIALDVAAGKMYWTNMMADKIQRAGLTGSNVEDLVTSGLSIPRGIALDSAAGKMYWTDVGTHRIQRADLDGTDVETLLISFNPRGIALDVAAGKMYWSKSLSIWRANLDGSDAERIVPGIHIPYGIALDVVAGKMYWTDISADEIRRADLDGSNREDLVTTGLSLPYYIALDVAAGKMYWTDRGTEKIQRADLDGSNVEDLITTGLSGPYGIALQLNAAECDADPEVSFTDSVAAGSCPQESVITRSWTVTDSCGNSSTCDQIISVVDTTDPVLIIPEDVTIECGEPSDPAHTGEGTATDNCGSTPIVTFLDVVVVGDCPQGSTITRTWTATDACGNVTSLDQTITVADMTAPLLIIPPDVTIECDDDDQPGSTGQATATDNCDGAPMVTFTDTVVAGSCSQEWTTTRTWTATDACGNATSLDQIITVVDITAPPITCPADTTIECDQSTDPTNTGSPTGFAVRKMYWTDADTDTIRRAELDGSDVEDLVTTGLLTPSDIALDVSAGKMYWTDHNTDKIQRADLDGSNVEDLVTNAVATPYGIALDVGAGKMYWTDFAADTIKRADLDGSNVESLITTGLNTPRRIALDIAAGKMYWTDGSKIKRADLNGSNVENLITGEVDSTGIALDVTAGKMYWANKHSDTIKRADLDGSNFEYLVTAGLISPMGLALDVVAGKMYWTDTGTTKIQRADLDGSNIETLLDYGVSQPLGIALQLEAVGCNPAADVSFSDSLAAGSCAQESVITRTWTVIDDCGNSSTCEQIITVVDTTDPVLTVPPDAAIECDEDDQPGNTGQATAADNCDDTLLVLFSDIVTAGPCPQASMITRNWLAMDDCYNMSVLTQVISVADTTAPVMTIPADVTIECDEDDQPGNTGQATAADNCDDTLVVVFSDSVTDGDCPQESTIARTWFAMDDCSNMSSLIQIINVADTTAPVIAIPADVTIEYSESTAPDNTGMATATDNCGDDVEITFSDTINTPNCAADPIHFTIERTWTATDDCDNSSSCVQIISVLRRVVSLIIKRSACPAPLNPNSNGVLPTVLPGDADFDVEEIVLSSLLLSRADCVGGEIAPMDGPPGPPIRIQDLNHPYNGEGPCACSEDHSPDGIDDLSVNFRVSALATELEIHNGEGTLVLSLTGELNDGSAFLATDCIVIVPPGESSPTNAHVESNVADTFVEIAPLDLNFDDDGFADFSRSYYGGTAMTLTAPPQSAGRRFVRWLVDGAPQPIGMRTIEVIVSEDTTLKAAYARSARPTPEHPTESDGPLE